MVDLTEGPRIVIGDLIVALGRVSIEAMLQMSAGV